MTGAGLNNDKILGVEGGGTKTAWALVTEGSILDSGKLPPSNLRLTPTDQLERILRSLPREVDRVGVFLAGCVTDEDRAALLELTRKVWAGKNIVVGSDRESGMAACLQGRDGIVVNAGTGSSVTGRRGKQVEKAGGWGHILGDTGGAYFVSIRALRVILRDYDLRRGNRRFAATVLSALGLNNFDELVRWAQTAEKTEVASLAPIVFAGADNGDDAVQRIIAASAAALADYTASVAARLAIDAPEVRLMGGMFEHQPSYVEAFRVALGDQVPMADVAMTEVEPELGAVWLAANGAVAIPPKKKPEVETIGVTEEENPGSAGLDKMTPREFVELFIAEERSVESALRTRTEELARAIEIAAHAIAGGGNVFYVGAGTSGRLGVMDAAEIPPTFGASRELIQAVIAGGAAALQTSVEGAEDDERSGGLAIDERDVNEADVVVGISASGRAPFVIGALRRAREIGSKTIALTCNPERKRTVEVDLAIDLPTGPEIVAGSTRLKAGTATKIALNIISTGAMVQLGKVHGNLMIDLRPTNLKLRQRAVRLVSRLGNCDEQAARARLERAGWNVRAALKE